MTNACSWREDPIGPHTTLAIIAPDGLQHALDVMIQVVPGITVVASEASVAALHQRVAQQPLDLVLLDAAPNIRAACLQIRQIKTLWPAVRCIVLVERSGQHNLVQQAGATIVLPKGVAPDGLVQTISTFASIREDERITIRTNLSRPFVKISGL